MKWKGDNAVPKLKVTRNPAIDSTAFSIYATTA